MELLSSAKLMHQENDPSKIYLGKCKLNCLGKLKLLLVDEKFIQKKKISLE